MNRSAITLFFLFAPRRCHVALAWCKGGKDLIARFFVIVQSLEIKQKFYHKPLLIR
jgi:hypothetical protein